MVSKVVVDTVTIWKILAKKPVDIISEVNLSTHMKKVVMMKKWPYPSGSNAIKNFTQEKIKYFFHDIEIAKDKNLESETNLENYV